MKELFDALPATDHPEYIVDTCFLYDVFTGQHEKSFLQFCNEHVVVLTSFTVEEILYHKDDIGHHFKDHIRHLFKKDLRLFRMDVPVHPGDPQGEKNFVRAFDPRLLDLIPDPSDAVIAVIALKHQATLLTKDKHHLFTTRLENYFEERGIRVEKSLQ